MRAVTKTTMRFLGVTYHGKRRGKAGEDKWDREREWAAVGWFFELFVPMDSKLQRRFTLGRQSSGAPANDAVLASDATDSLDAAMDSGVRLMYLANEGDLEGIQELLDSGTTVNFRDIDGRTALHVAACQGLTDVVELLLLRGAEVDVEDRWGSTPLADAIYYKNNDVIKILEAHGAKPQMAPMHVENAREVPEYEIDPRELDFTNSVEITKGTFCIASWRGIQVAVKKLGEEFFIDEEKVWVIYVWQITFSVDSVSSFLVLMIIESVYLTGGLLIFRKAFRDELALLQKMRHPNVVQFLGAVTQSTPMMIVTEYLPKVSLLLLYMFTVTCYRLLGDFGAYLKRRGALKPTLVIKFALDIARGMNYLHEHKPEAIIHRDLEPPNILRDDSGHLKVADFGLSKLMKVAKTIKEDKPMSCQQTSWRYVAPEVFRNEEYDTKVDVFSFALILQEMIEGCPPFPKRKEIEVAKAYVDNERPPFQAPVKHYAYGLRQLIEDCWNQKPSNRPTFKEIILKLDEINKHLLRKRRWKVLSAIWHCIQYLEIFSSKFMLDIDFAASLTVSVLQALEHIYFESNFVCCILYRQKHLNFSTSLSQS
ncbi:hypothetical protein DH2020_011757 [Rehmannia glutinosa]|uniref:Protein kinase domain-containing protein n=1 Tax=Rehmannia glutinosa TaxID=99300 RepID=A0ABR0XEE0_REHGL